MGFFNRDTNGKKYRLRAIFSRFKSIKAKDGKFSILGNHDYGDYGTWKSKEEKELSAGEIIMKFEEHSPILKLEEHKDVDRFTDVKDAIVKHLNRIFGRN